MRMRLYLVQAYYIMCFEKKSVYLIDAVSYDGIIFSTGNRLIVNRNIMPLSPFLPIIYSFLQKRPPTIFS